MTVAPANAKRPGVRRPSAALLWQGDTLTFSMHEVVTTFTINRRFSIRAMAPMIGGADHRIRNLISQKRSCDKL